MNKFTITFFLLLLTYTLPIFATNNAISKNKEIAIYNTDTCDIIYLRDGTTIKAKVEEVSETKIKYKNYNNLEGPSYIITKNKVLRIKYANGTSEIVNISRKKYDAYSIVGFISGIVGLIIFGLPLGAVSLIFGVIAVSRINRKKTKGKVLALFSIVLGFIDVVGVLIYLSNQ